MIRAASILLFLVITPTRGLGDWPQFRGPTGQGVSLAKGLPLTWSDKDNIAWKTLIPGEGWSSPVIWGEQIWLTSALDRGKSLRAICVARDSGKIVHDVEVFTPARPVGIEKKGTHAAPTPVLEEGRLYVHFGTMGTACVDTTSGKVLWRFTDFEKMRFGETASSPVVFEDRVLLHFDGPKEPFVAALDKATGQLSWKRPRSLPLRDNTLNHRAFATPLVVPVGKAWQLISPGPDQLHAYDPRTGNEIWHVRYKGFANVPRPLFADGRLFFCTGFGSPSELWAMDITADCRGDITQTRVAWKYTRQIPTVPSPVLWKDRIYMASSQGIATCLDARTGKMIWQERLNGSNISASLTAVDDRLYLCDEEGATTVLETGDTFRVLARNTLPGRIFASPAIAGKAIFVRTDKHLYRIESPRFR